MSMIRTTVYVDSTEKDRLHELSETTGIPEARLWREALQLLLRQRAPKVDQEREQAISQMRASMRRLKISKAYDTYKAEERRLESKRDR